MTDKINRGVAAANVAMINLSISSPRSIMLDPSTNKTPDSVKLRGSGFSLSLSFRKTVAQMTIIQALRTKVMVWIIFLYALSNGPCQTASYHRAYSESRFRYDFSFYVIGVIFFSHLRIIRLFAATLGFQTIAFNFMRKSMYKSIPLFYSF